MAKRKAKTNAKKNGEVLDETKWEDFEKKNKKRLVKFYAKKRGAGLWDTIKDSKIISGAASHIPFLGPLAGSLLGAFGLGHGASGARVMPYRGMGAANGRIDGSIGVSNVGRVKF